MNFATEEPQRNRFTFAHEGHRIKSGGSKTANVLLVQRGVRQKHDLTHSDVVRAAEVELDSVIATALEALATRAAGGSEPPVPALEDALNGFDRSMTGTDALDKEAAAHFAERLALYRALVAAINRLSSEFLNTGQDRSLVSNGKIFFESRETQIN